MYRAACLGGWLFDLVAVVALSWSLRSSSSAWSIWLAWVVAVDCLGAQRSLVVIFVLSLGFRIREHGGWLLFSGPTSCQYA